LADSIVIIPTYNEKENITDIIDAVLHTSDDFDILIVDDGSPDGTANLVKEMMQKRPGRVHMIERSGKLGLGTAYIAGFEWGLDNGGYEFLCEMDADFSHPPMKLIELRKACIEGGDFAIGSRYVKGGSVVDWSWDRILLSKGASVYVQMILGMSIKDPTSGFKCYRKKVLEKIDLKKIDFVGYAFQIAMKYSAVKLGFSPREIPISFKDRERGTSKMSFNIFNEAVIGVWKMRNMKFNRNES
jgi:dolichol-phosphate mannosyltransferase